MEESCEFALGMGGGITLRSTSRSNNRIIYEEVRGKEWKDVFKFRVSE